MTSKHEDYRLLGQIREEIGRTTGMEKMHLIKLAKQVEHAIKIKEKANLLSDDKNTQGANSFEAERLTADLISGLQQKARNGKA